MDNWCLFGIVFGLVVTCTSATHFRGAIITWQPGINQNEILVDYRISWRMSYNTYFHCNDRIIQTGQTVPGTGNLTCFSGCSGTLGILHYQCTDYSTTEDWSSGKGRITYRSNTSVFEFGFIGGDWISTLNYGRDGSWRLQVKVDLRVRGDTGRINSSPVAEMAPIVRLQYGCTHTIHIPVSDADQDIVRCRWAANNSTSGDECASVCWAFPHAYLDEDACTLTYTAQYSTGWYAIAIQVEDFVHSYDRTPLSSIPLQFLAYVYTGSGSCTANPEFIDTTPHDGECIVVLPPDVFQRTIVVSSNRSISEIKTVSPLGMTKSPLTKVNSTTWEMTVTWSPAFINTTANVFCFTAVDTDGQRSEKRCITLLAGVQRPTLTPVVDLTNGRVDPTQTIYTVAVDIPFVRGSNHSYIKLYNGRGALIERIDATDSSRVFIHTNNQSFSFDTSTILDVNETYYFKFDKGVVKSSAFCGADSYAIQSPTIWTFYTDAVPVRLVDGNDSYSGRVEVFYRGIWGTICDDEFDVKAAEVICRMLGLYSMDGLYQVYPAAYFGSGSGTILLDDVRCTGNEQSIADCASNGWYHGNCDHSEDVGVACYVGTPIRLMNGSTQYEGRVEVYHNGTWGTVCDDGFDREVAIVFCKMLGFYSGRGDVVAYPGAHFGEGSGPVTLDDLYCDGSESSILQCMTRPWFKNDCSHSEDAGIDCRSHTGIRLVNGPTSYSGRVELYHRGQWGTVCDDYLDDNSVKVFCKMLGMYIGDSYGVGYNQAYFGQGTGSIVLDRYDCYGNETDIIQCVNGTTWEHSSCSHSEDIGIDCHGSRHGPTLPQTILTMPPTTPPVSIDDSTVPSRSSSNTPIRLVDGRTPQSGRVEVYHNHVWGTVCDDDMSLSVAIVFCKMLGYYIGNSYVRAYNGGTFSQGVGQIALDNLQCTGHENDITQCMQAPWFTHDCSHSEDAGIDCRYGNGSSTSGWYQTTTMYYQTTTGYRLEDAITVRCTENGWDIEVDMYKLRLVYPGAVSSDIYLGENTCTGTVNWNTLSFSQGLHECLTAQMIRNNNLIYRNELLYAERDPVHPYLVRHFNWTVAVECDIQRNETSAGYIHHESGSQPIVSTSHYSVNMSFYSDPNYIHQIPGNPVHVTHGSDVYVKVFSPVPDWSVKMRVNNCYTRPTPTSPDSLKFDLITDGCEMDSNTHFVSQSTHETRFVFQDFAYTTNHDGIYVYCDTVFCSTSDYSKSCTQTCNP